MLYLTCTTCTMICSVDLAHFGVSRANDWVSVDCGTMFGSNVHSLGLISRQLCSFESFYLITQEGRVII